MVAEAETDETAMEVHQVLEERNVEGLKDEPQETPEELEERVKGQEVVVKGPISLAALLRLMRAAKSVRVE
jgi:hypothetical protein